LFFSSIRPQELANRTYTLIFGAVVVVVSVWVLLGWSLAFGQNDWLGIVSDPVSGFVLNFAYNDPTLDSTALAGGTIGVNMVKLGYELIFPIFGSILIAGMIEQNIRLLSFCAYIGGWVLFFYAPMVHMIWGGGILDTDGALEQLLGVPTHDFNGGLALLIGSGMSALVLTSIINHTNRKKYLRKPHRSLPKFRSRKAPDTQVEITGTITTTVPAITSSQPIVEETETKVLIDAESVSNVVTQQHRQVFAMFGLFLVVSSWLVLNVGTVSDTTSSSVGVVWVTTLVITVASIFAWFFIEKLLIGAVTQNGMILSTLCGLACSTPIADVISPGMALIVGVLTSILTFLCAALVKRVARRTAYIDYISVILFGAIFGLLFVGIFASSGWVATGSPAQLIAQIVAIAGAALFSLIVSLAFGLLINRVLGFKSESNRE
jgi:ammonia channel protein AmtB